MSETQAWHVSENYEAPQLTDTKFVQSISEWLWVGYMSYRVELKQKQEHIEQWVLSEILWSVSPPTSSSCFV